MKLQIVEMGVAGTVSLVESSSSKKQTASKICGLSRALEQCFLNKRGILILIKCVLMIQGPQMKKICIHFHFIDLCL